MGKRGPRVLRRFAAALCEMPFPPRGARLIKEVAAREMSGACVQLCVGAPQTCGSSEKYF